MLLGYWHLRPSTQPLRDPMYLNKASGEVHGAVDPSGKDSFSALICPPALLSLIITGWSE